MSKYPRTNTGGAVRNTNDWHLWNTFSPICRIIATSPSPPRQLHPDIPTGNEGWLESNTLAKLDIFMQGNGLEPGARKNRDVLIAVTLLEQSERDGHTVYTLAWKNNQSRQWKLHTERVVELVDTGDGWTDYTCHETFGGFSSSFVKKLVGNTLLDRSGDIASNLKTYMEGGEPVEPKGSLCDGRGKGSIRGAKKPRRKTRLQIRQEERRMNTNSSRRQSF